MPQLFKVTIISVNICTLYLTKVANKNVTLVSAVYVEPQFHLMSTYPVLIL